MNFLKLAGGIILLMLLTGCGRKAPLFMPKPAQTPAAVPTPAPNPAAVSAPTATHTEANKP